MRGAPFSGGGLPLSVGNGQRVIRADSISAQMNPPSMKPDKLMSASTNSSSCVTGIVVTGEGFLGLMIS